MNYLLDTNHWSYLQRRHPAVLARIRQLPQEATLYMPVVAQAALLAGVELAVDARRKEKLRSPYEKTTAEYTEILVVDSPVAEQFAAIVAQLRRAGNPIDTNDVWIAAIVKVHDLTVGRNDVHFKYVEDLSVEDWSGTTAPS